MHDGNSLKPVFWLLAVILVLFIIKYLGYGHF